MAIEDTAERLLVDENASNSPLYLRHKIAYIFAEKYIKDKIVLDDGCGSGYGSSHLKSKGARKVIGVDISKEAIEYAEQRYKIKDLNFETMDVTKLSFDDNTFDTLTSFQVIEHIRNVDKYLAEIKRVLKKTGIALISTPNKKTYSPNTIEPENPFHVKEFYFDEFKDLLNKYFGKVQILGVNQSKKVENLESSTVYSARKNLRILLEKMHLLFFVNIIPKKIRRLLINRLNKDVDISDFTVTEVDTDHALDFMAICTIEK